MKVALVFFLLCFFLPSYNYYLNHILQYDLGMESISAFSYITLAIVGIYAYTYLLKINSKLIALMAIVFVALFISYLRYPEIKEAFISEDYNPLTSILLFVPLMGFPMMIYSNYLGKSIIHYDNYIRFPSVVLIILAIIDYYWTVLVNGHYFEVNYMSFSYYMLPAVCFSFYYGISKGKIIDSIISFVGLIFIFVTGARGSFLCGVIFFAMSSLKRYSISIGKFLVYSISIIALFLAVFYFLPSFSEKVMSYMDGYGATSRTLIKISEGTLDESDTRNALYNIMSDAIRKHPLGYGPMGDRYILYRHDNQGYAHSIIYEFLIDYGVFLGPVLLVVLLLSVFFRLKIHFKQDMFYVYALFLAIGLIKLFFSESYLEELYFWGLVGLLFTNKDTNRNG